MAKKRKGPVESFPSAWFEIRQDDETGEVYWYGGGAGDKEATEMSKGEPLIMPPDHWPVGTRVDVTEPWDEEFYDKLFEERQKMIERGSPAPATPDHDAARESA